MVGHSYVGSIALLVYSVGTHSTTHRGEWIKHHYDPIWHLYSCTTRYHDIPELLEHLFVIIAAWSYTDDLFNHRLSKLSHVQYSFTTAVGLDLRHWKHKITHSAGSFLSTAAYRIQDHFLTHFPDGHTIAPVFVLSCVMSLQGDKPNKATSGIHGLLKHTK